MELKHAETEIKITAEILDADRCRFTLDRPVFRTGGLIQYLNREKAQASPLAKKLFEIENVTAVQLAGDTVTVAKKGAEDWTRLGKKIGTALRKHLQSETDPPSSSAGKDAERDGALEDRIRVKVQQVLDAEINPGVVSHGGSVSLLDVKGTTVYIKMSGGCQGCGMAALTLKQGIEKSIRQHVPEVGAILDETDHAAGWTPYYTPSTT